MDPTTGKFVVIIVLGIGIRVESWLGRNHVTLQAFQTCEAYFSASFYSWDLQLLTTGELRLQWRQAGWGQKRGNEKKAAKAEKVFLMNIFIKITQQEIEYIVS